LKRKIGKLLRSERGDTSYITSYVYILVAVIMIVFIINVFKIISAKQEMDHMVDQMVKQIQLSGGTNSDTAALFNFLSGQLDEVRNLQYTVTTVGSPSRIQIGTPFYITVTGSCTLGGMWNFDLVNINLRAQGAGVSEHYWK